MLKANELRIGNYHYYHIVDELDERKEWDEVSIIDAEDIAYLSKPKGESDPDYKPIPLTEEWLIKGGCINTGEYFEIDRFRLSYNEIYKFWYVFECSVGAYLTKVEFIHEWQNVFFALNGQELAFKK